MTTYAIIAAGGLVLFAAIAFVIWRYGRSQNKLGRAEAVEEINEQGREVEREMDAVDPVADPDLEQRLRENGL